MGLLKQGFPQLARVAPQMAQGVVLQMDSLLAQVPPQLRWKPSHT